MCQPVADNAGRRTYIRSAARDDLAVPATRTLRYGPRSFAVAGPSTWNSLPAALRSCHLLFQYFGILSKAEAHVSALMIQIQLNRQIVSMYRH